MRSANGQPQKQILRSMLRIPRLVKRITSAVKYPFKKRRKSEKSSTSEEDKEQSHNVNTWIIEAQRQSRGVAEALIIPEKRKSISSRLTEKPDNVELKFESLLAQEPNTFITIAKTFQKATNETTERGETVPSGNVPAEAFLEALLSIIPLFDTLGINLVTRRVRGDLHEKASTIRRALERENVDTVRGMIMAERQNPPRPRVDANAHEAFLWSKRTLQFGYGIFFGVIENKLNLQDAARESYATALEPHHGNMIKGVFSTALRGLPSKEEFIKRLYDISEINDEVEQEFVDSLRAFIFFAEPHLSMLRSLFPQDES